MLKKITLLLLFIAFYSCKQAPDISTQKSITAFDLTYDKNETHHYISAHRGGKGYNGYPENCLETIDFLIKQGVQTFEIDLAATKDNQLVLLHDDQLSRTTNGNGNINNFNYADLDKVHLTDDYKKITEFNIPLLKNVLELAKSQKAILMLDFKKSVAYKDVINLVRKVKAEDYVVLISYNQNQAETLHRLAPEIMLSVSIRNQEEYTRHAEKEIPDNRMIAFVGISEPSKEHYQFLHQKGIMTILGTLGNLDKRTANRGDQIYTQFFNKGADILSSDRPIEAQKAIKH